jgi:hypothetical protein
MLRMDSFCFSVVARLSRAVTLLSEHNDLKEKLREIRKAEVKSMY